VGVVLPLAAVLTIIKSGLFILGFYLFAKGFAEEPDYNSTIWPTVGFAIMIYFYIFDGAVFVMNDYILLERVFPIGQPILYAIVSYFFRSFGFSLMPLEALYWGGHFLIEFIERWTPKEQ